MKRLLIFLTFLAVSGVAYAGDPTTDFLEAPFVNDFVTLSTGAVPNGKPTIKYTVDRDDSPRTADTLTFRSNGEIAIHIGSFNPFTQSWTVETKATPDVNFTAITAFLGDLKSLQGAVTGGQTAADTAQKTMAAAVNKALNQNECDELYAAIHSAYDKLMKPLDVATDLQKAVNEATGLKGVTDAKADLLSLQKKIQTSIMNERGEMDTLRIQYSSPDSTAMCRAQVLADYVAVNAMADRVIAAQTALGQQILNLAKMLDPYLDATVWYAPNSTDYVIKTVTPTFADQQTVTATAKVRTVTLKDDNSLAVTTDDANAITASFTVRKNSLFAAERAAAVIYNNLKYPQYGTAKNASGATVVQRTMDHQPVNGALMLNLVMRLRSPSVAYPFLQLGVSSAKDFPGFLAGVGLRFAAPFNFSISAGGMITRYKDLDDSLKVGDAVTGTDDINKHLVYKTSPVVLYGAMQLKF